MQLGTLATFLGLLSFAAAAKILLLPTSFTSHVQQQSYIGEDLIDRGHEVHMVLSPSLPSVERFKKGRVKILTHHTPKDDYYMMSSDQEEMDVFFEKLLDISMITEIRTLYDQGGIETCTNPLSDEKLFKQMKAEKYDLAILDVCPFSLCLGVWIYRLGIPFIAQTTTYLPWLLANPNLPSVAPMNFHIPGLSEKMTFRERAWNLWQVLDFAVYPRNPYSDVALTKQYAPELPPLSMDKFMSRALLWLIEQDFALDYPRPVMPNEILIGGLATKPVKPLSAEMQAFMDSADEHGVIIVSFGTFSSNLPMPIRTRMFDAFKTVKQHVIWRYLDVRPEGLPDRIKLVDWMPQNDLLGHKNTKLFLTHGGASGQFEGLYHGVPMITIPLFGDQKYNSVRAESKGYSLTLDVRKFTAEEMVDKINTVIRNDTFRTNVKHGSKLFRSQALTPRQRAVYWIEHIMKYGGDHLHSHALDMPGYQWLMLDIIVPAMLMMLLFPLCILLLCKRYFSG